MSRCDQSSSFSVSLETLCEQDFKIQEVYLLGKKKNFFLLIFVVFFWSYPEQMSYWLTGLGTTKNVLKKQKVEFWKKHVYF